MIHRFHAIGTAALLGVLSLVGCYRQPSPPMAPEKLPVMVSILPQKYFVEQIGKDLVTVDVMVPPGAEPHTFEPKPEQLKALSRAKAYLRIRIDFEQAWMDKFAAVNPKMVIVDTTQGIQRLATPAAHHEATHGETPHTSAERRENLDPHIWLSPRLVKTQAQTIADALGQLDPNHRANYQANRQKFQANLDTLDADIRDTLKGVKNRKFIVFHPSWSYFARDYQLEQIPIEVGGQEPSAAELADLIAKAKQNNIKVVFAEPQFSKQTAETIAKEIGGEVVVVDPLSPDWQANLRNISQTFARTMNQSTLPTPSWLAQQMTGLFSALSWNSGALVQP